MLGNIFGGIECIGLMGIFLHYSGFERQEGIYFYLIWAMVIIPLIYLIMVFAFGRRDVSYSFKRISRH